MTKKPRERVPAPTKRAMELTDMYSPNDLDGSYTGNPKKGEKPMQDADDL